MQIHPNHDLETLDSVAEAVLGTLINAPSDVSDDVMTLSDVNSLLSDFIPDDQEDGGLTPDLLEMIREHLLAVEGIKADNEPALYALAITVCD